MVLERKHYEQINISQYTSRCNHTIGKGWPSSYTHFGGEVATNFDRGIESMMIGKFIPCKGLSDNPDITIRCACGFAVEGMQKSTGPLKIKCRDELKRRRRKT